LERWPRRLSLPVIGVVEAAWLSALLLERPLFEAAGPDRVDVADSMMARRLAAVAEFSVWWARLSGLRKIFLPPS
jgi:hypothetical protein